ncbi:MAG: class I SAM-dependent methyltransferase [Phycisphaerales bacterium]|nr:class I SAM-dependent methyltransferase [Phycisphaerales bacterium]
MPLRRGMRVLEIGCGPGAAARLVAERVGDGYVLGIDRSSRAIGQAVRGSEAEIRSGRLAFRCVAIEDFVRHPGEAPFGLAFAVRVGVLDGRHPKDQPLALERIGAALARKGRLFVEIGGCMREVRVPSRDRPR